MKYADFVYLLFGFECKPISGTMSVVPYGQFAARKVRENEDKRRDLPICDLTTTNYNAKYMDSIWGMYNRYAVHNLKKNMDKNMFKFFYKKGNVEESSNIPTSTASAYL